jgi:carboxypeptidase C (cathepsin A)
MNNPSTMKSNQFYFILLVILIICLLEVNSLSVLKSSRGKQFFSSVPLSSSSLYLSNYLPHQARELSKVSLPIHYFSNAAQLKELGHSTVALGHSGYITVSKEYNSNTFFWFFPALDGNSSSPLLVWMNGGPGATSLYGLFEELGPYYSDAKGEQLYPREITWNAHYSIIYIDNPVGTGFSFTDSAQGYCTDQTCVGDNLYSFLTQFFTIFPDYVANDLYIAGESYGGKYVPAFASKIDAQNKLNNNTHINLRGISIGDGELFILHFNDSSFSVGC